jgi:hypothetical protein
MATFTHPPARDKVPAFVGLVVGAIAIFIICFGVVKWTNARFDARHGATPAAAGQH